MMLRLKLLLLIFLIPLLSNAQEWIEDVVKVFETEIGKRKDSTHYPTKFVYSPIVSYDPTTSLGFGGGMKFLFKLKDSFEETRTSNIPISARYTLKNQFLFFTEFTIFSNQENWLYRGNLAFLEYPISFYGIGNQSMQSDEVKISYSNFLLEPIVLKRIKGKFFSGGGIRYNNIYNARLLDQDLEFESDPDFLEARALGVELAFTYDDRSNVLNSTSGWFVEYTLGTYDEAIGSTHNFNLSKLNARTYVQVAEARKYDVLAFEFFSRFSWGDVPTLELSSLGGASLLRGTVEGRYRDKNNYFFQSEYRWQTFERLGLVFFAGLGQVFDKQEELAMDALRYSLGSGLRLKVVKAENLNIRFDYGFKFGDGFDSAFYLSLAEAF